MKVTRVYAGIYGSCNEDGSTDAHKDPQGNTVQTINRIELPGGLAFRLCDRDTEELAFKLAEIDTLPVTE